MYTYAHSFKGNVIYIYIFIYNTHIFPIYIFGKNKTPTLLGDMEISGYKDHFFDKIIKWTWININRTGLHLYVLLVQKDNF